MSLDVYLMGKPETVKCNCPDFGNEHERQTAEMYYSANITHNLGAMAEAAGIYEALWRPEDIGAKFAADIILVLEKGLNELECFPETYSAYNSENGWGVYKDFVPFVTKYLQACREYPEAIIEISR